MKNLTKKADKQSAHPKKEKDTMRKLKKSLAVLLAALMLASFMPLFASAATVLNKANATIVEAPKLSYKGGEPSSNLIVPNGATKADISIVGGKLEYQGTPVDGFFSWTSSATGTPPTTVLSVGDVNVALYFHPTDTTNYARARWTSTATNPVEGWPTLAVKGLDATIVEAPAVSGDLAKGNRLNTLTLSGGKVVDADGNDITAQGKWSFVNGTVKPEESGEQQVQWKLSGYDVPKTYVYVTVTLIQTTLAEAPVAYFPLAPGAKLNTARIKPDTGKVVDEEGNDVTANGTWTIDMTGITNDTLIWRDTVFTVTWTAVGYATVTTQMLVGCRQPEAYYIDALPKFAEAGQTFKYSPDNTWGSLTLIPGKVTDKVTGEEITGSYELYANQTYKTRAENNAIGVSNVYSYGKEGLYCFIKFVPDDPAYPAHEFGASDRVYGDKGDFTLTEDSEIVLMYGDTKTALNEYYGDLKYSTLKTIPENIGIDSISWSKDVFDPSTADYGSVTMVEVRIKSEARSYNDQIITVPIRIMNYIHDYTNPWYGHLISAPKFFSTFLEEPDGIRNYKVDFTNNRLKGTVDLIVNEEVVVSVAPDENGRFYAEGQWIAPASGDYTYRFEYKPSENDSATVKNPVYPHDSESQKFTMDVRPYHTATIIVGDKTFTITERYKSTMYFNWQNETELGVDDFGSWTFTDENGNEFTPVNGESVDGDPQTKPSIYIVMPDHDFTAVAKGPYGEIGDSETDAMFGSLWSFWQKLVQFIIDIYTHIMNMFG